MSEVFDVSAPIRSLCEVLGLDAEFVCELVCHPTYVEAEVYKTNAAGSKFCAPGTSVPMKDRLMFVVKT
jgi:hypothetical protein